LGTPPGGIAAEVVVVSNFEELAALGRAKVEGKIVLFNAEYRAYNVSRIWRTGGASRAAALGAVAALVRSVTPLAMQIPHTGAVQYEENAPRIPAAAISPEDAMMIARLTSEGIAVKVRLEMGARMLPDADSANVIGEIPGTELPEEVVVLGGHLDSWDVGQGAQDDGAAVIASLQALALMKKLGIEPRRTIRVAFWVNEENGARGGVAYREWVGDQDREPRGGHRNGWRRRGAHRVRRGRRPGVDGPAPAGGEAARPGGRGADPAGRRRRRYRHR
jgi:Zn-dependent M28 family amino/carboxypeptidase